MQERTLFSDVVGFEPIDMPPRKPKRPKRRFACKSKERRYSIWRRMTAARLDEMIESGKIKLDLHTYGLILLAMFREEYEEPPEAPQPIKSQPGSDLRIEEYAARVESGYRVFSQESQRSLR